LKTLYTAVSTAHGGRDGHVWSSDGIIDLDVKTPKGMCGPGGAGTNPEQLFASGYAACFESAMRVVARMQKKPLTEASVTGHVNFNVTGRATRHGQRAFARGGGGPDACSPRGLPLFERDSR
jgi:Ohr subfamily peroxiredoxin